MNQRLIIVRFQFVATAIVIATAFYLWAADYANVGVFIAATCLSYVALAIKSHHIWLLARTVFLTINGSVLGALLPWISVENYDFQTTTLIGGVIVECYPKFAT